MAEFRDDLKPVPYQEIPKGFCSFSRDHLTDAALAEMDTAVKEAGGRIETHTLRNKDGGRTVTQQISWYLLPLSAVPKGEASTGTK